MTLYSYIVKHDSGFAPNPFFGYCTLACCKPGIRRKAQKGDWIVGLTPKADGNRMVYFMEVEESIEFDEYWRDARFRQKKPKLNAGIDRRSGDNIYKPGGGGKYRQLPSIHSKPKFGKREDRNLKKHDLSGKQVLISEVFAYFGSKALPLPPELLKRLVVGRGHKCRFSDEVKAEFHRFVSKQRLGMHAKPGRWPQGDESWKSGTCGRA